MFSHHNFPDLWHIVALQNRWLSQTVDFTVQITFVGLSMLVVSGKWPFNTIGCQHRFHSVLNRNSSPCVVKSSLIYLFVDISSMASEDEKFFESDDDDDKYFEVYTYGSSQKKVYVL